MNYPALTIVLTIFNHHQLFNYSQQTPAALHLLSESLDQKKSSADGDEKCFTNTIVMINNLCSLFVN